MYISISFLDEIIAFIGLILFALPYQLGKIKDGDEKEN